MEPRFHFNGNFHEKFIYYDRGNLRATETLVAAYILFNLGE